MLHDAPEYFSTDPESGADPHLHESGFDIGVVVQVLSVLVLGIAFHLWVDLPGQRVGTYGRTDKDSL